MPLEVRSARFARLASDKLAAWQETPSAIAGDAMNRARCMDYGIKPLRLEMRVVGQARTIQSPAGDNAAIHAGVALARPGDVLVIDAAGHRDTAVWGGILTKAALKAGIAGVILDGATRDSAEVASSGLSFFCRAVSSRGGQKTDFGMVDGQIAVGGVTIQSGDLVIADDDGVAVVPLAEIDTVLKQIKIVLKKEADIIAGIDDGKTTAELLGVTIPLPRD